MPIRIAPSILSADLNNLGDQIREAVDAGADWIHVDVMDGSYVPNITFGPNIVSAIRKVTDLPIDVHLMIVNPERHFQTFADAGTDHLTIHFETCPHIDRSLHQIRDLGMSPAVVINPVSPASFLREILYAIDSVLIMSVNPGFGGQSFIKNTFDKIRHTKSFLNEINPKASIQIDGGISAENIKACYEAGASVFIAGSSIFKHPNGINAGIEALRKAVESAI